MCVVAMVHADCYQYHCMAAVDVSMNLLSTALAPGLRLLLHHTSVVLCRFVALHICLSHSLSFHVMYHDAPFRIVIFWIAHVFD